MKKLILSLTFGLTAVAANAASVSVAIGSPAQTVKLSGGEFISTETSTAIVGYFLNTAISSPTFASSLADPTRTVLSYIAQNFVPLGNASAPILAQLGADSSKFGNFTGVTPLDVRSDTTTGNQVSINGAVNNITFAAGTANSLTSAGLIRGTRLALIVFNSDTLDSATQLGVFSAIDWTVPTSSVLNSKTLALSGVDTAAEVFRGSLGSLVLAPIVPEPGTASMGVLAALGLLSRRRRA